MGCFLRSTLHLTETMHWKKMYLIIVYLCICTLVIVIYTTKCLVLSECCYTLTNEPGVVYKLEMAISPCYHHTLRVTMKCMEHYFLCTGILKVKLYIVKMYFNKHAKLDLPDVRVLLHSGKSRSDEKLTVNNLHTTCFYWDCGSIFLVKVSF